MPRTPRSKIFHADRIGIYHCTQRCVRQAFLCGRDPVTGTNYEHRRQWIRKRMRELARIFAFQFLHYAILSNHLHVIVRNRPDRASQWSDREVVRRWWQLYPQKRRPDGRPAPIPPQLMRQMLADPDQVAQWRARLQDLSWLMKSLAEPIARQANAEEEITGRFWQGRFFSQELTDEAALLACAIYVDLNCVRAGLGASLAEARFTSIHDRLRAQQARRLGSRTGRSRRQLAEDGQADTWLAPLELVPDEPLPPGPLRSGQRISDQGFLEMPLAKYVELAQWTLRHRRQPESNRQVPPETLQPLLVGHGIRPEVWLQVTEHFGRWFGRCVGRAESMERIRQEQQANWLRGIRRCRQAFLS